MISKHLLHVKENDDPGEGQLEPDAHHVAHKDAPAGLQGLLSPLSHEELADKRPGKGPDEHAPGRDEENPYEHTDNGKPHPCLRRPVSLRPDGRKHVVHQGYGDHQGTHDDQKGDTEGLPLFCQGEDDEGGITEGRARDHGQDAADEADQGDDQTEYDEGDGHCGDPWIR
jgi:hypothetical protein